MGFTIIRHTGLRIGYLISTAIQSQHSQVPEESSGLPSAPLGSPPPPISTIVGIRTRAQFGRSDRKTAAEPPAFFALFTDDRLDSQELHPNNKPGPKVQERVS